MLIRLAFLLIFCFTINLSYGQGRLENVRVSVAFNEASVQEVFRTLEEETPFKFTFIASDLESSQHITYQGQDVSLDAFLKFLSREANLSFRRINDNIHVKASTGGNGVKGSSNTVVSVRGQVIDKVTKLPLANAAVYVEGTTQGTVTDAKGNFQLSVKKNEVLVFRTTGYESIYVSVTNQSVINVQLEESLRRLSEIVIVGYNSASIPNITGAVHVVDKKKISQVSELGVTQAVQGRIPGVYVGREGGPGGRTMVRVRGFSTIGNNEPLYIIDGIPTQSGLNDINPNDIVSVQVLKDAAAASIYGARAGNGVMIITTINGKQYEEPKVEFSTYAGIQFAGDLPKGLAPQDLANLIWSAEDNDQIDHTNPHYGNGSNPVIPDYLFPNGAMERNPLTDLSLYSKENYRITKANKEGTNWLDEIFGTSVVQNYHTSVRSASKWGQYAGSFSYFNQGGVLVNTDYSRYTARVNTLFKVGERFSVGENISFTYSEKTGIANQDVTNPITMALRMPTIIPVRDEAGNFAGSGVGGFNNPQNPVALLVTDKDDIQKRVRTLGNVYLEGKLFSTNLTELMFKSGFGLDYGSTNVRDLQLINFQDSEPIGADRLVESDQSNLNWVWYNTLTYQSDFGANNQFEMLIGTEAIRNSSRFVTSSKTEFFIDDTDFVSLGSGANGAVSSGNNTASTLFSVFSRLNLSFNDTYLFSATVRRDGSSRFSRNNRFAIFPAASAGVRLSEYDVFQQITWISDLKLRTSWGRTGNQEIGDYATFTTYASDINTSYYPITGTNTSSTQGFDLNQVGNQDLKWETITTSNVGLDASLFQNKLGVTFDWYTKRTSDMLVQVPIAATAGLFELPYFNLGEMKNNGVELSLNYSGKIGELKYTTGLYLSKIKNRVVRLGDNREYAVAGANARSFRLTRTQAGFPISYFYGYDVLGIFQTQEEADNHALQGNGDYNAPGRFKYRDVDGNGVINADDRTMIGSPHPDLIYGIDLGLAYKGFDFSLFLQGLEGNEIYNFTRYFTDFVSIFFWSGKGERAIDTWSEQNPNARLPQTSSVPVNNEVEPNSYFVEDGSYLRVKSIQLGYNLPAGITKKLKTDHVRVFIQGKNLFTFTKYTGLDPEINLRTYDDNAFGTTNLDIGVDRGAYPIAKSVMIGLNVEF